MFAYLAASLMSLISFFSSLSIERSSRSRSAVKVGMRLLCTDQLSSRPVSDRLSGISLTSDPAGDLSL